jgi:hypothetical protein
MASVLHFVSAFALSHSLCGHFVITLDSGKDNIFMTTTVDFPQDKTPAS